MVYVSDKVWTIGNVITDTDSVCVVVVDITKRNN